MLVAIDIETAPGPGFEDYPDAALDFHRNKITQIAVATEAGDLQCFQTINQLNDFLASLRLTRQVLEFGGHNFKFDLKTLITKGAHLSIKDYHHDSMLQAVADYDKIPEAWLAEYNQKRLALNAAGAKHRDAGPYSLKTLAPYKLGVEPFWETSDHNDVEYALKDARYTLDLIIKQNEELQRKGCSDFYTKKLMRWARMFLEAESTGLMLDLDLLTEKERQSQEAMDIAKYRLLDYWKTPIVAWEALDQGALDARYYEMTEAALARPRKKPLTPDQEQKVRARYRDLYNEAVKKLEPFNIDSPSQLMWLLKDYYQLDVTTFEGDESTGKSVLNKLADQGREDIKALLTYRKHSKLLKAFFPSYKAMKWEERLHPSFNLNGARTGRISCSNPNIQQTPAELHDLIVAGEGYKLICYDLSNIEPMLIAYLTEDPVLCDIMIKGESFHDHNVKAMFGYEEPIADIKRLYPEERKIAKTVGLAVLYGAGWKRVQFAAQTAGFEFSKSKCEAIVRNLRRKYQTVWDYKEQIDERLMSGEPVSNLLGRQFRIPDPQQVYMKGFNTLIQGSGSDILIESACRIQEQGRASGYNVTFLASVHDEMIIQAADKDAQQVDNLVHNVIQSYRLDTRFGSISLKVEGGIYDYWKH